MMKSLTDCNHYCTRCGEHCSSCDLCFDLPPSVVYVKPKSTYKDDVELIRPERSIREAANKRSEYFI